MVWQKSENHFIKNAFLWIQKRGGGNDKCPQIHERTRNKVRGRTQLKCAYHMIRKADPELPEGARIKKKKRKLVKIVYFAYMNSKRILLFASLRVLHMVINL